MQETTGIRATAISGGMLYHGTDDTIRRYDADSAVYLWQTIGGATSLAVTGNALYYANPNAVGAVNLFDNFPLWTLALAPGCSAYVRVVTSAVAAVSRCAGAIPHVVNSLTGRAPSVPLQFNVGDVPIAASKQVMIGVTATGGLRAWSLVNGDSLPIHQPAATVRLVSQSGPVIGRAVIVVPENGRLEVIG